MKFGVSEVRVHEVPPKLSLAYMITVHPAGILTEEAQSLTTPLAAKLRSSLLSGSTDERSSAAAPTHAEISQPESTVLTSKLCGHILSAH